MARIGHRGGCGILMQKLGGPGREFRLTPQMSVGPVQKMAVKGESVLTVQDLSLRPWSTVARRKVRPEMLDLYF